MEKSSKIIDSVKIVNLDLNYDNWMEAIFLYASVSLSRVDTLRYKKNFRRNKRIP